MHKTAANEIGGNAQGGNGGNASGGSSDCSTGNSLIGINTLNFNSCNGGDGESQPIIRSLLCPSLTSSFVDNLQVAMLPVALQLVAMGETPLHIVGRSWKSEMVVTLLQHRCTHH